MADHINEHRVRMALVGLGQYAQYKVLPTLMRSSTVDVTALVSGDEEKRRHLAQQYQSHYHYSYDHYEQCLANPEVDAVYLLLPPHWHESFTIRAVRMGKHVLCEKSMAMTVAAAQRMLDAAQENHVVLMMAYRMPFDSSLQRVYEALRANELGTIKQVNSSISFNVPDGWRLQRALSGGGALMDLGIYPIHTLCWLLQQDPVTVQGHAWSTDPRRFQEVEESVAFRLEFSQGLQAQCAASYGVTDHSALFIGGDKGWISMSSVYDFDKNIVQQTLTEGNSGIQTEMITRGEDVGSMLDAFAQSIQTGRVLPDCSGERGLRDQHILAALYQSMALRQPIDLVEMLPESVLPLT